MNEPALLDALDQKRIAGAALDRVWEEPLPATSPLWGVCTVLITLPTAGETRRYEDKVIALLLENLERLWRGRNLAEEPVRLTASKDLAITGLHVAMESLTRLTRPANGFPLLADRLTFVSVRFRPKADFGASR